MTDPMMTAEFDQAHAQVRDTVDGLIDGLAQAAEGCPCGHAIDSQDHMLTLVGYLQTHYPAHLQSALLAEALTRLAVAREASSR
ncbi:hypothetical protein [Nocardia pseudovaccinii]|uniref:hypothetical protein n=1 Tax=Nocardia pseudovaccinii TaxID=189540 RepID=UPI0007A504F8|nr:hypothetical protein [Nocardia pseudovaccinii]